MVTQIDALGVHSDQDLFKHSPCVVVTYHQKQQPKHIIIQQSFNKVPIARYLVGEKQGKFKRLLSFIHK